ncbi:MAG: ATP-grasp domain-containing protein [Fibrobacteres bacterium]|nr:ATP-grasp domain-containing protein [Fibrobacterota bacterium]
MSLKIGLTYDLRDDYLALGFSEEETAEFDRRDTIDAIENAIRAAGHSTDRIGQIKSLAARLVKGDRWDLVFNIAEGMYGLSRETQVPALLDAYNIPCTFSDAVALGFTLHKGFTKNIVRDCGVPTPDFAVLSSPEEAAKINLPFPLFAKPVAEGTGKGINSRSKARNKEELIALTDELLKKYKQPVIVETFLPGREFTVGIVGSGSSAESVGIMEVILNDKAEAEVYSYVNKERCEDLVEYRKVDDTMAKEAVQVALDSWKALGLRDAGRVDLRADAAGRVNFLEVNPLAGLHPEHSDLPIICTMYGISYNTLIKRIIDEASKRITNK